MSNRIAVLIVSKWDSKCSTCGGNADPNEKNHEMNRMVGEGCGAHFVAITSEYLDWEERLKEMRPDLPVVNYYGADGPYRNREVVPRLPGS